MQSFASILVPVGIPLLIGAHLQRAGRITDEQITGLTYVIINICLPAVLLLAFLQMSLEWRFFWLSIMVVVLLSGAMLCGYILRELFQMRSPLLPFYTSGFSFGFLGIPLVTLVFGPSEVAIFTVLGVGHEVFVWFVYYPLLSRHYAQMSGERSSSARTRIVSRIRRSPVTMAIIVGILGNLMGVGTLISPGNTLSAVGETLDLLARATTPLILIVVGFGIRINADVIRRSSRILAIRFLVTFAVAYGVKLSVLEPLLGFGGTPFDRAFFSLIMLPGLYSLPVYVGHNQDPHHEQEASAVVSVGTVASMVLFLAYLAVHSR